MTETVLANRALRHAKLTTIESADEDTPHASFIREILPDVLSEGIEEKFDWTFCRRRKALSMIPDLTFSTWLYSYSLPDDMVQLRHVCVPDSEQTLEESEYEMFEYRDDADRSGSRLASDYTELDLRYVGRIRSIPDIPLYFANAISWLLAYYLADHFGGTERAVYCFSTYRETMRIARAKDDQRNRQSKQGSYTPTGS